MQFYILGPYAYAHIDREQLSVLDYGTTSGALTKFA